MEQRQRPERLAGEVLAPAVRHRRPGRRVVRAVHLAALVGHRHEKGAELTEYLVVALVARTVAAQHESGSEQGARPTAERSVALAGERTPPGTGVHAVEGPLDPPLGGRRGRLRFRQTGAGGLLEAHRHAGVAGDVVAADVAVGVAVVAVQPGTVVALVADEPPDGGVGGGTQLRRGRVAALLGLDDEGAQPAEHEHPRQHTTGDDSTQRAATSGGRRRRLGHSAESTSEVES